MLKGRLERRKKRAEKSKAVTDEQEAEAAKSIAAEVAAETRLKSEQVERDADEKLRAAKRNQEGIERAQQIRHEKQAELERLAEEAEQERMARTEQVSAEIRRKHE